MASELCLATASELIALVKEGKISAVEVVEACQARVEALEDRISAWAALAGEAALLQAREVDRKIREGNFHGRLYGVPVGVKDVFNTADLPTEMGSLIWRGFKPGNDARVVFNLRYEGGVVLGKTQTSEFAVHEPTATVNPRDFAHMPGTSSTGSAAAVAAGMVPLALGTQTGGSTIRPASYCGVYGYKPTFGAVPRTGVLKTTDTLDTIGWFARSIDDIELMFEVARVRGHNFPYVDRLIKRAPLNPTIRLGLVRGPKWDQAEPYAQEALLSLGKRLAASGRFQVEEAEIPEARAIFDEHELIYCKALSYYFRSELWTTRESISQVLVRMLDIGERITPEQYLAAVEEQSRRVHEFSSGCEHDAMISLAAGGEAPPRSNPDDRPDTCKIWTYLGVPALTIPLLVGPAGLPIGLQVTAPKYADYRLLDVARAIEAVVGSPSNLASIG